MASKNMTNSRGERQIRNQKGPGKPADGGWEMQLPIPDQVESLPGNPS